MTIGITAWGMRSTERIKVNDLEIKCLRNFVRVTRMDTVKNKEMCRRTEIEKELMSRVNRRVLKWFGRVENG